MSGEAAPAQAILCLGEALVDLVCEGETKSLADADCFRPHPGGALANVAVAVARGGADAALAGGAGDDEWGRWLRDHLRAEGVDVRWFTLVAGASSPIAFVTFDRRREPRFEVRAEGIGAGIGSLGGRLEPAIGAAGALVLGSNTLAGEPERGLTMQARELALERGLPVLFDPNLRPNRWHDLRRWAERCREVCAGAYLVRSNRDEARLLAGCEPGASAEEAADVICRELDAREAVVTLGPQGALARGEVEARRDGIAVAVVAPLGAGDAFMGALAAGLARRDWKLERIGEALGEAVEAGARACRSWAAVP